MAEEYPSHTPVLPEQILEAFDVGSIETLVDCTVGLGGHAGLLLEHHPDLKLIGLDLDAGNLALAARHLEVHSRRTRFVQASFADLDAVLTDLGIDRVDGILADLGVSSNQLAEADRGLSFSLDGPLDMRLDLRTGKTAADLVNTLSEGELSDLLYLQSQERHSRRIARRICQVRRQGRINSTVQLARIVSAAMGLNPDARRDRIHPATRTFMALRMAVNHETESLGRLLSAASRMLRVNGRVAIVSFHSVEDRAVKEDFRARSREGLYRILTKRPLVADEPERVANPRSRSAKLRIAERCGNA